MSSAARSPGRPRDASRDLAILDATAALLVQNGADGLRLEDVAAVAGTSKATIYRRWAGREELLVAALARFAERAVPVPDTGDLRDDLVGLMTGLGASLTEGGGSRLLLAVLGADRHVGQGMHRDLVTHRRMLCAEVLSRAQSRGQLGASADVDALSCLPAAMIFFRVLLSGESVGGPAVEALVDQVVLPALHGAAAGGAGPTRSPSGHLGAGLADPPPG